MMSIFDNTGAACHYCVQLSLSDVLSNLFLSFDFGQFEWLTKAPEPMVHTNMHTHMHTYIHKYMHYVLSIMIHTHIRKNTYIICIVHQSWEM